LNTIIYPAFSATSFGLSQAVPHLVLHDLSPTRFPFFFQLAFSPPSSKKATYQGKEPAYEPLFAESLCYIKLF
jgi:hypothetical protein